ncbi:hypothetical protein [Brevundimonas goettingensis]|uniref:Uncharacterized protein n=1 Tax=Brevundimonas goettingensis TaxID=2774190 RepID=A0A975C3S1_9CAUL|nr:hypothetical protein [Brevundimonas goettingensis]QTC90771.1 hypothetical protein IFJ75_16260 [Brevundimonas goettingensis]
MRRLFAAGTLGLAALLSACAPAVTTLPRAYGDLSDRLKVVERGYPQPGGPCWLLGETYKTSELFDDSADLLACPRESVRDPRVTSVGRRVGEFEGVIIFSVPRSATAAH